jgi:hypothetical protein
MKDNNITVGCNPPANTNYCPDDNVTRGQMATFMKRLAENNVVDAATLDGIDSTGFIPTPDAVAYTTQINGVACEGGTCPGGAALTVVPILSLGVNAPADGVMQISFLHQNDGGASFDFVQSWIAVDQTLNGGCGAWLFAPGGNVPGTYAISWQNGAAEIPGGTNAGSAAVNIGAGDHTVVLCGAGSEAFTSQQASISTVWSQVGSGGSITGAVSLSDAELAQLEDAMSE